MTNISRSKENTDMRQELVLTRDKPLKAIADYLIYHTLILLLKFGQLLPLRMTDRYSRSAAKRNPRRSLPDIVNPTPLVDSKATTEFGELRNGVAATSEARLGDSELKGRSMTLAPALVSVLIPSYNHAPFVGRAVESVLAQTYSALEVIVVDDASTDGTATVVADIKDPRLRLIRNAKNGLRHPRNLALGLAQGKYVAFQNSDDVWLPEKLERQVALMEEDSRVVACFSACSFIDDQSCASDGAWAANLFDVTDRPASDWLRRFFDRGNCLPLPTAVVRRETLVALDGFSETLVQLGDFDLWLRLATQGSFRQVPAPLAQIRIDAKRNLSAPNRSAELRTKREFATVLLRYAEPAALRLYSSVFPDLVQHSATSVRLAAIARYASRKSDAHKLFADLLFERLFNSAHARREITDALGTEVYQAFIEARCHLDFTWTQ